VLKSLLNGEKVDFKGEFYAVDAQLQLPWAQPCPVVVAALAPLMLKMAGELADGTVTWMVGLKTMQEHIIPRITAAAQAAGRPAPRICIGLPVSVTDDVAAARARAAQSFANYGNLPVYKRMLDIEGGGPEEVLIAGSENEVEQQLRAFAAAGATEFNATPFVVGDSPAASVQRTRDLLKSLAGKL
jgi:alkanesulfonate monooxygenase SsuD/methylene tetrahydromethanopterin reductase-like flavin-dependent oxidoreductase (luciferase family)